MWIDLSKLAQKEKIFVSHMNAHQRVTQQRRILIIKKTGWPVLWMSVSLLLRSLLLLPNGFMNKWPWNQGWQLCWAQQHECSLSRACLDIAMAECPICQWQRLTLSHWYGTVPYGISHLPIDMLITLVCFHHARDSNLSYWIQICLFCLSACNSSSKTTIGELTEYFIQKRHILHSITFDQGTHFTAN